MGSSEDSLDAEDEFASLNSVFVTASLLVLMAIGYRINTHRLKHLPESGAAMALGVAVGLIVRIFGMTQEEQLLNFNGSFFFFVLLPPIILEAGFSLKTQMFVDNLGTILVFAVLGTIISTWATSYSLHSLAVSGWIGLEKTPLLAIQCHLFGALISATDPVATIALFGSSRFRANPFLHSLINGEAVLNDAVAIVLFSTISHQLDEEEPQLMSTPILGHFFFVSLGSLAVGLAAGGLSSWCFCRARYIKNFPDYEISAILLASYLTFAFSQLLGLSGIMSLFFFGIVLAQYNYYSLSEPSKVASKVTFSTLSKMAESCVFVYLGVVAALSLGRFHWHLGLVLCSILAIIFARAVHVFPLTALLNLSRERKIDRNMQLVMWISGLRGAIAFALSLRIPCARGRPIHHGSADCRNSDLLVTTTISIVMLTTLVVGTAMERVMTALGVIELVQCSAGGCQLTPMRIDGSLSVPLAADGGDAEESGQLADSASDDLAGDRRSEAGAAPPEYGGGPELPASARSSSSPSGNSSARSFWPVQRFSARGQLYQAFAQFDLDVLQPALGGPCRARAAANAASSRTTDPARHPRLQVFTEQPGLPRSFAVSEEDMPPTFSRSVIFE